MALQISLLVWGLYKMNFFLLSSIILLQFISSISVVKMVSARKNPSYKIAWIAVILLIPVLGFLLYLMWGRGSNPKKVKKQITTLSNMTIPLYKHNKYIEDKLADAYPNQQRPMNYLIKAGFPVYSGTFVSYFDLGDKFFPSLIEDMKKAEKFIFMEFFILSEGELWQQVLSVLKERAAAGVNIRILYDDFGCITCLPENFEKELRENGIQTAAFNKIRPVVNNFYMNYRSHQKICVIDGNIAYTGGVNLADEYINTVDAFGHWKDSGIRMAGDAVWSMSVMFLQMWEYATYNKKSRTAPNQDYTQYLPDESFCSAVENASGFVQPFVDGPLTTPEETEAEYLYMQIINSAKKYIYITTPYLVPDNEMITALRLAARSGIDVRIITPGIPDKKYVYLVTNLYYGILLEAGVKIYEYLPGFIHAKNLVCDDEAGVVGTINMDFRSFYLHFENGVFMCGCDAVGQIKADFLETLKYCREIDLETWKKRPKSRKAAQTLLNLFAPLL